MINIELKGADELEKKLTMLPGKVAKKVVRNALRKGIKIVEGKAKLNALTMIGGNMGKTIKRYITTRTQKRKRKSSYGLNVLISKKGNDIFQYEAKDGSKSYIPAAIEYGHDRAKPIPFMRRAYDLYKRKATDTAMKEMARGIERESKK